MPETKIPDGCEQCPNNIENKPKIIPYPIRVAAAMFAGLILATQCYSIKYGQEPANNGVEVAQVGRWNIETKEPSYLFAMGCAAVALTLLGIRVDTLIKLFPGQR